MDQAQSFRYIIESVTQDGKRFRPSDWIDRLSSWDATFAQHRLVYSERLHPVNIKGEKCLAIEPKLKEQAPAMFDQIIGFARANKLKAHRQTADGEMTEIALDDL
ncbi:MAG TPA: DUF3579 domain-containing protein [Chromatiales bacterium]|nr:DUF3579 domain-containing protein [Chromatiales bacterium]